MRDDQKRFLQRMVESATVLRQTRTFNPRVLIAQAMLESGWGQSELAKKHYNYFGIKAGSLWQGDVAEYKTREVVDGKETQETARFRSYETEQRGLNDYLDFIANSPYFAEALNFPDDDEAYVDVLVGGEVKYATDPKYKKLILDIIETSGLRTFFP